jgi:hypothetical protein
VRCPNCSKFTSLSFEDPEVESLDVEVGDLAGGKVDLTVTATVRVVRTTECCGDEAKEATLEMKEVLSGVDVPAGVDVEDAEVEEDGVDQVEEGGGRYAKSWQTLSYRVSYVVRVGDVVLAKSSMTDKVAASHMEELL